MKINMNDTPEEMELTYNDLLAKWESIPEAYRGHPYQLYEKLLNLFPTLCADDKKAEFRVQSLLEWTTRRRCRPTSTSSRRWE